MTSSDQKRKMTLRGAVAAILAIAVATPVLAAVLIQNFLAADIQAVAACFTKVEGGDASSIRGFSTPPSATTTARAEIVKRGPSSTATDTPDTASVPSSISTSVALACRMTSTSSAASRSGR